MAYFDNAATTYPKPECVYQYMDKFYRECGGNAGRGNYEQAKSAGELIANTRSMIQDLLHCPTKQVVFEPTATIALNLIIQGNIERGAHNIYVSPFEHNAVTRVLHHFEKQEKIVVRQLTVGENLRYDMERIRYQFEEEKPDIVVNFAAESHVDRSIKNPEVFVQTNVLGTAVMLNCAKAAWEKEDGSFQEGKKFLHVSTDEVYGSLSEDGGYFYETTPYAPHSPYSASKASSDMLVKAYMDTYHFPANITNCSNNYGPYQFPEKFIPLMINNALQGKKLPVYGDGKNVRDWLYVEDHAKAIDMVQEQGRLFETYNVGGHNEKQNIEILHIILDTLREMLPDSDPRKALVSDDLITYVEDRKGHDRRYAIAPDKIKAEIGWQPETMFKDGIKKTIKWYFEHEDWMKNATSGEYQKYYDAMYKNR